MRLFFIYPDESIPTPQNGVPAFHIAWHGCRYPIRILGSRWSAPPKKKKNGSIPKPGQIVSFRWGNLEELMVFFGVESNIFLAIWYWSWQFWTTILRHQKWIQLQVETPRYVQQKNPAPPLAAQKKTPSNCQQGPSGSSAVFSISIGCGSIWHHQNRTKIGTTPWNLREIGNTDLRKYLEEFHRHFLIWLTANLKATCWLWRYVHAKAPRHPASVLAVQRCVLVCNSAACWRMNWLPMILGTNKTNPNITWLPMSHDHFMWF